ncbi:MAG: DUF5943 domain-containing protein [Variibacter sp.]
MGKPAVSIEVDDATGRWYVDGLPMILMPQHFFLNNHYAVENALGTEKLNAILAPAGHLSAYVWCEHEAKQHGLSGEDVFRHYMKRLSQRGWAQFEVVAVDGKTGRAEVKVTQSIFVTGRHGGEPRKLCGMFAPWMHGSLEYVAKAAGGPSRLVAREVYCQGEGNHDHCLFGVTEA